MSDYRDVMESRTRADTARRAFDAEHERYENGAYHVDHRAIATLLAAEAVCAEIRSLATVIDYALHDAMPEGRP